MITCLVLMWLFLGFCGFLLMRNWYQYQRQWNWLKVACLFPAIGLGPVLLIYGIDFIEKKCHNRNR